MNKYSFSIFILSIGISFQLSAQDTKNNLNADSIAVVEKLNEFVGAFSNLKWEKFTACFADDATAFFPPSAKFPYRANNKKEIENIFSLVFENAKKQKQSAPYIIIQPKDVKVQMAGTVAIVTFLLNDPAMLGRRTIVLQKMSDEWLIIHLHASGVII